MPYDQHELGRFISTFDDVVEPRFAGLQYRGQAARLVGDLQYLGKVKLCLDDLYNKLFKLATSFVNPKFFTNYLFCYFKNDFKLFIENCNSVINCDIKSNNILSKIFLNRIKDNFINKTHNKNSSKPYFGVLKYFCEIVKNISFLNKSSVNKLKDCDYITDLDQRYFSPYSPFSVFNIFVENYCERYKSKTKKLKVKNYPLLLAAYSEEKIFSGLRKNNKIPDFILFDLNIDLNRINPEQLLKDYITLSPNFIFIPDYSNHHFRYKYFLIPISYKIYSDNKIEQQNLNSDILSRIIIDPEIKNIFVNRPLFMKLRNCSSVVAMPYQELKDFLLMRTEIYLKNSFERFVLGDNLCLQYLNGELPDLDHKKAQTKLFYAEKRITYGCNLIKNILLPNSMFVMDPAFEISRSQRVGLKRQTYAIDGVCFDENTGYKRTWCETNTIPFIRHSCRLGNYISAMLQPVFSRRFRFDMKIQKDTQNDSETLAYLEHLEEREKLHAELRAAIEEAEKTMLPDPVPTELLPKQVIATKNAEEVVLRPVSVGPGVEAMPIELVELGEGETIPGRKISSKVAREINIASREYAHYDAILRVKSRSYNQNNPLSNSNPYYIEMKSPEQISLLFKDIIDVGVVGYDIETTDLSPVKGAEILTHQFSTRPYTAVLVRQAVFDEYPEVFETFKNIMQNPQITKVIHNVKFEYMFLKYCLNIEIVNFYDTMIAAHCVDENRQLGLKSLAMQEFNVDMIEFEEVTYGTKKYDPDGRYSLEYACADADIALQLYYKYKPITDAGGTTEELSKPIYAQPYNNYAREFAEIELPIIPILAQMELDGIMLNIGLLKSMKEKSEKRLVALRNEIAKDFPDINPDSPDQVADLLYNRLKLPVLDRTSGGKSGNSKPSTQIKVLERLKEHHPIVQKLIDYGHESQLMSLYLMGLPKFFNPLTCAVHTQINQASTVTGRFSSENPNLQNLRRNQDD